MICFGQKSNSERAFEHARATVRTAIGPSAEMCSSSNFIFPHHIPSLAPRPTNKSPQVETRVLSPPPFLHIYFPFRLASLTLVTKHYRRHVTIMCILVTIINSTPPDQPIIFHPNSFSRFTLPVLYYDDVRPLSPPRPYQIDLDID